MKSNNFDSLNKSLLTRIENKQVALFCGAGISFNSGLPLANTLIKHILRELDLKDADLPLLLQSKLPFEAFIQTLMDEVESDHLLEIFGQGEPSTTHDFIAGLIKRGYITTVMTTNFDQLIEKALENIGFKKDADYLVYITEEDFSKIDWNDTKKCKIIKIHGCVSDKNSMAITLGEVAKMTIGQHRAKTVNSFFSSRINHSVMVLGYSCSDIFDISPEIERMINEMSEIHFIDHIFNDATRTETINLKEVSNPFRAFDGTRYYVNTDVLLASLGRHFFKKEPVFKQYTVDWKQKVEQWTQEAITFSYGIKYHIAGRLLYDVGEYDRAITVWNQGIPFAQKEKNQVFFYSLLGNLGMAYNAFGQYSLAKSCLEESVNACEQLGNIQGFIAQSQALGNIYRNIGEYEKAITVFKKIISVAKKNQEIYGLCSSLGNLANVYNQIHSPDETIEVLKEGIPIALVSGHKQFEGSMKCNLGVAFAQKGDLKKAAFYIEESVQITRSIGDKNGECMALINLSNVALSSGDYESCAVTSKAALKIAIAMGLKQNEAGANYNIGSAFYWKGEFKEAIPHLEKALNILSELFGLNHPHSISAAKTLANAQQMLK